MLTIYIASCSGTCLPQIRVESVLCFFKATSFVCSFKTTSKQNCWWVNFIEASVRGSCLHIGSSGMNNVVLNITVTWGLMLLCSIILYFHEYNAEICVTWLCLLRVTGWEVYFNGKLTISHLFLCISVGYLPILHWQVFIMFPYIVLFLNKTQHLVCVLRHGWLAQTSFFECLVRQITEQFSCLDLFIIV